ncbi:MAG TPA: hypothetical protein VHI13_08325 [Candidatus Kapabacteria bacterium]|nr:hypothetical protein [Candidatus Kapabacteria bacterium]
MMKPASERVRIYGLEADANPGALGEKAMGLIELESLGLRVPEALIVPPGWYERYRDAENRTALLDDLCGEICVLQESIDGPVPLLSFRCGMKSRRGEPKRFPDSVLNIGLNPLGSAAARAHAVGDAFVEELRAVCAAHAEAFHAFLHLEMPHEFPDRPLEHQMRMLVTAFYDYLMREERTEAGRPLATVIVQRMVFGNLTPRSLTGMCYTRHPHTGLPMDYGHFIRGRQGMALGGTMSPRQQDLSEMPDVNPDAYRQLRAACTLIEEHYNDVRCLEYTAEDDVLFLLQNSIGNRTFRMNAEDGS